MTDLITEKNLKMMKENSYDRRQNLAGFFGNGAVAVLQVFLGNRLNIALSTEDIVFYGCRNLTCYEISDSVTSIGDRAFWGCTGLTNIEIPNGVTHIGNYAFWGCTNLINIEIPNSVTNIGDAVFRECASLTSN